MKGQSPKISAEMWNKLVMLGEKQGTVKLKDLASELGLGVEETLVFLREIFPSGNGAEIYYNQNECMVDLNASSLQYMLPLSPGEWIQLYQVLSQVKVTDTIKNSVLASLKKKITENGPVKVLMEIMIQLEKWDQQITEKQQKILKELDRFVEAKSLIQISSSAGKRYSVFPWKVIHLEGKLSLIAEEAQDHCMMVVPLIDITEISDLKSSSKPKVTLFEIDEFITAVRAMNEKETRLILKILDPQSVNLFPEYHFLGKPCMVTNPSGDLIWAAYVEPCDDLFEWLITLGNNVEILDPIRFREEFLTYCGEKLRKIA